MPHLHPKAIECCGDGDRCNSRLRPQLPEPPPSLLPDSPRPPSATTAQPTVLVAAALCVALVAFLAALLLLCRRRRRAGKRPPSPPEPRTARVDLSVSVSNSGSGAGLPLLVQRTIAKQIRMIEPVGKGRRGEVWAARWRGERVAVKVFFTAEEAAWFRETEIYQTVLVRHENVLAFVAADVDGGRSWTRMLLITEYHERGSLRDYLRANTLSPRELAAMAHSVASGLAHLHMDIFGAKGKPAIAHGDLKSGNVLVKRNGQCAIGDFALAARHVAERNEVDVAAGPEAGTRRYQAPEVLDETLDRGDFEHHKMADVYSLALVLWEMCRRCTDGAGRCESYAPPYHESVSADPGLEEMHACVVRRGSRPTIPSRWREAEGALAAVAALLPECWHRSPPVRLTALRVKKTLTRFVAETAIKLP